MTSTGGHGVSITTGRQDGNHMATRGHRNCDENSKNDKNSVSKFCHGDSAEIVDGTGFVDDTRFVDGAGTRLSSTVPAVEATTAPHAVAQPTGPSGVQPKN